MWLVGGTVAVLTVAGGIATNQVLTNHVWSWPWFAAAVLSVAAAGAADRRAAVQPRATLRSDLVDAKGQPLLVGQVTLRQLGVHPSRFDPEGDSPYIERDVDKDEDWASAMREGDRRLLIVQGPRLAGTTRTLAEIARTSPLASYRLLAYVGRSRGQGFRDGGPGPPVGRYRAGSRAVAR